MSSFNQLCKYFEEMDPLTYSDLLEEYAAAIIPALADVMGNPDAALKSFGDFIMAAIVADGRLSDEEYLSFYPLLESFFGDRFSYEDCKYFVRKLKLENEDTKSYVNDMIDIVGMLDGELKDDIIMICLMVCAIDGKVSAKEKAWIKQLIDDYAE